jgi:hypothetical protein
MATGYRLACDLAQMNIFNMVHHDGRTAERTRSLVQGQPLVADAKYTLGLLQDEFEWIKVGDGHRGGRFVFAIDSATTGLASVTWLHFLPAS